MKSQIIIKPIGLEHPTVKKVMEIAEEIMNENKLLNIENLYYHAKKRLKIPREGLLSIINFLLSKKILIEGSKFSKETVLSNKIRYNIFQFIKQKGGAHFSLIRKNLIIEDSNNFVSPGQLIWHLEMLLKFQYIKKIKVGNYSIFIPFEMNDDIGILNFLLRDRINRKIFRILLDSELIKKSEIYKLINEIRSKVYYRINYLMKYNIIIEKNESDNHIAISKNIKKFISHLLVRNQENWKNRNQNY